jgi:transposase
MRRKQALALVAEGKPLTLIATELNVSVQTVRSHLRKALATESLYPASLSAEEVGQLRQVQAEVLANSRQKAIQSHETITARIGTKLEKAMDATASARLLEAVVRAVDLEASLFGTRVPQKAIIETFSVNLERSEKTITISFDAGALEPPSEPIPGLSVWRNGQLIEGPGNESAELESGFGLNGHVMTAGALPSAPINDSREDQLR